MALCPILAHLPVCLPMGFDSSRILLPIPVFPQLACMIHPFRSPVALCPFRAGFSKHFCCCFCKRLPSKCLKLCAPYCPWYSMKTNMDSTSAWGCGCVPGELYLQKQVMVPSWSTGCGLPTFDLGHLGWQTEDIIFSVTRFAAHLICIIFTWVKFPLRNFEITS